MPGGIFATPRTAPGRLLPALGGALIRLIAGDIGGFTGPGVTHTPIAYAHVTLAPGAQLSVPWNPAFNALVYVLAYTFELGLALATYFGGAR